jgi:putative inorganic carbon (HCO3(-)) transporter
MASTGRFAIGRMVPADTRRLLALSIFVLAGTLIGLPWATGGRSPAGQACLVLLLALAGGAGLLPRSSDRPLRLAPPLLFGGMLVGASALLTIHPDRTIQSLLLLVAYAVAAAVAARAVAQIRWAERVLLDATWISGFVVTSVAIAWWLRGNDGGFYANALIGPFGYPNALGGFLLLACGAALASVAPAGGRLERAGAVIGCAISLIGLYLTRSRGILLAAAAGLLLWTLTRRDRWWPRRPTWRVLASLGLVAGLAMLGVRLTGIVVTFWSWGAGGAGDTSTAWRLHILRWTWAMIRDHPWLGVGPGAFPVALTHYQRIPYVGGENPHNLYLEVAAEYGAVAGILVSACLILILGQAIMAARRLPEGSPARGRLAALVGAVAAFATHSAFDLDWSFPAIALMAATILGIVSACPSETRIPRPRGIGIPLPRTILILILLAAAAVAAARYYSSSLVAWGRSDLLAGDLSAARQNLNQSLRLNPLSYPAYQWLAWTTLQSGDPQKAIEIADRTIGIAPQDPNGHALIGEIALAAGRWRVAQTAFRRAVDQAPMAHLRYHAGLLEAASKAGNQAEAIHTYEQAISLFTPERVLHSEARCLAPGNRYLLARMGRIVARLYDEAGDRIAWQTATARSGLLAEPDLRGICATGGRPGQRSPESAVVSFWRALSEGGLAQAEKYLLPNRQPHEPEGALRQIRLTSIYSLDGGERLATLRHEVEIDDGKVRMSRCARAVTRLTRDGWFLEQPPSIDDGPCPP